MGRVGFPPHCFTWGQTMVEVRKVMATSFRRACAGTAVFSAPDPSAGRCRPTPLPRLLDTHRQVWLSLLWGHCSSLLAPCMHKVLFVPSKSLFPQSCGSSVIKSHCPQSQILWGFSVSLPDPQVGKSAVGPRTFLTVWKFLWYNCSAVCGTSAWQLYGGANGDLLQEGLCHTLCDPGLLQPEALWFLSLFCDAGKRSTIILIRQRKKLRPRETERLTQCLTNTRSEPWLVISSC